MNANNVMSLANAAAKSVRKLDARGKAGSAMAGSKGKAFGDVLEKSQGNDPASLSQDVRELAQKMEDMAKEAGAVKESSANQDGDKGNIEEKTSPGTAGREPARKAQDSATPGIEEETLPPVDVEDAAAALVASWGGGALAMAAQIVDAASNAPREAVAQPPDLQSLLPRSDEQSAKSQQMLAMLSGQMLEGAAQKNLQQTGFSGSLQGTQPAAQGGQGEEIPGLAQRVPLDPLSAQQVQMAGNLVRSYDGQQTGMMEETFVVPQGVESDAPIVPTDMEVPAQSDGNTAKSASAPAGQETSGKGLLDGVRVVVEDRTEPAAQESPPVDRKQAQIQAQGGQPAQNNLQQPLPADGRQPAQNNLQQPLPLDGQPSAQEIKLQGRPTEGQQPMQQAQEAQQPSPADGQQLVRETRQPGQVAQEAYHPEHRGADTQEQPASSQGIQQPSRSAPEGRQQGGQFQDTSQQGQPYRQEVPMRGDDRQQGVPAQPVPPPQAGPMALEEQVMPGVEFGVEEIAPEELPGARTAHAQPGENSQAGSVFQQAVQNAASQARTDAAPVQQARDDFNIPQQIVEQARLIRAQESTEMVIRLKPEHLGNLTLKVSVAHNGAVTASFYTDNAQVRSIVENSLVQLRQELENQGIKVDKAEVYAGLSDGQLPQEQGQQSWQQNQGSSPASFRNLQADRNSFEETALELSGTSDSTAASTVEDGVDYRV